MKTSAQNHPVKLEPGFPAAQTNDSSFVVKDLFIKLIHSFTDVFLCVLPSSEWSLTGSESRPLEKINKITVRPGLQRSESLLD